MRRLAFILGFSALVMSTTTAQVRDLRLAGQPAQARRLALVIGNDAYVGRALRNAVADARAVAVALRDAGFAVTEITDATQVSVEREIANLAGRVTTASEVVVFFAGHG